MSSWQAGLLLVNLSTGVITPREIPAKIRNSFLGARGLNSRILYDMVDNKVDALSPENVFIIGTGAIDRQGIPGASRVTLTAKSPLTDILGDANAGGRFGIELKGTPYHHLVFTGKADKPVYFYVQDGKAEIRDATHLWGKTTRETFHAIRKEVKDQKVQIATIGPAGEHMVRFACVALGLSDYAGRTGMGAVMGSKNLKAVVVRGHDKIDIARPEEFKEWMHNLMKEVRAVPAFPGKSRYGTKSNAVRYNARGLTPFRNYQDNGMDVSPISHLVLAERDNGLESCPGCTIHCKHGTKIKEGPNAGEEGASIEFTSQMCFGSHCCIFDPDALIKINNICNDMGLDVASGGQLMGFAMDWYDNKMITDRDTGGIPLTWGNAEAVKELLRKISHREGFGDILSEGSVKAAKIIGKGAIDLVTHCKGLEFGVTQDCRGQKGFSLNLATSTRGADHERGLPTIESFCDVASDDMKQMIRKKFGSEDVLIPTS